MAKSTFLQFCQTVRRECGIIGSGPTTVANQVGDLAKVVAWVADADRETQGRWFDWDFLHVDSWSEATTVGVSAVAAPATLGVWDEESFVLDYNTSAYRQLDVLGYKEWRSAYRNGVLTNQQPSSVVIKPDQSLLLVPTPDSAYTLTADYWAKPIKMTADGDTSPIPEEYERIIVARAKISYGEDQAAGEILIAAQIEYDDLLDKLEAKYLPNQQSRRRAENSMMVVRPE